VNQALRDALPLAIAIAVFPIPIIAVVLMVGSDRGRAKGLAFVLAWCLGLAVVGAIALALADGADANDDGAPSTWAAVLLLAVGLFLLASGARKWRSRPRAGEKRPTPGWMLAIDDFTALKAAGAGFVLSALNPKNVLLVVAAAVEIAAAGVSANQEIAALLVFVAVASIGVLFPLALAVVLGDRSRAPLERLRAWMARQNAVIMALLFVVIGAKLIADAVAAFSS
jgi:threonine/homoserine/homoserine lactone efflux protein